MTNFEKIKNMTVEELADYIFYLGNCTEYCYGHCAYQDDEECPNDGDKACLEGVRKWLESESKQNSFF